MPVPLRKQSASYNNLSFLKLELFSLHHLIFTVMSQFAEKAHPDSHTKIMQTRRIYRTKGYMWSCTGAFLSVLNSVFDVSVFIYLITVGLLCFGLTQVIRNL